MNEESRARAAAILAAYGAHSFLIDAAGQLYVVTDVARYPVADAPEVEFLPSEGEKAVALTAATIDTAKGDLQHATKTDLLGAAKKVLGLGG